MKYYMGIDCGSTTCKVVIIDETGTIKEKVATAIQSDPIETIKVAFKLIEYEGYKYSGIGVTGSSRNLIAKYLNTNFVRSEIISHTFSTLKNKNDVRTIIEIGGQDSKYISVENGIISEFKMNSVCAAGTGSFLQWQAEKMGVSMEEFDKLAINADKRLNLNGRCTVFIESSLINLKRIGESRENIAYAICRCLAQNYISEMCKAENIQDPIVFQGGVAKLKAMRKAFEEVLNKKVLAFEDCQFMGAIGVALLAVKEPECNGFNILQHKEMGKYKRVVLKCTDCQRNCDLIKYVSETSDEGFIVGGKCGKY